MAEAIERMSKKNRGSRSPQPARSVDSSRLTGNAATWQRLPWRSSGGWLGLGMIGLAMCLRDWLGSQQMASQFVSLVTAQKISLALGGSLQRFIDPSGLKVSYDVPFASTMIISSLFVVMGWLVGGWLLPQTLEGTETSLPLAKSTGNAQPGRYSLWGKKFGQSLSWLLVWQLCWTVGLLTGWESLVGVVEANASMTLALSLACALWAWWSLGSEQSRGHEQSAQPAVPPNDTASLASSAEKSSWRSLLALTLAYSLVFISMNWALWFNLRIPHGDSAMYEEHLWNILHGKGFRSYLDQGFFLGEHLQVIHLGLLPLYSIWKSHLLLEMCETLALASGALIVFQLCLVSGAGRRAGFWLGLAYLMYFPMQFLDIEIDLKTFRPEAFGIPLLLLTLWQLELWRLGKAPIWRWLTCLLITLTVKEDYSLIFGPLGLWLMVTVGWQSSAVIPQEATSSLWQRCQQSCWRMVKTPQGIAGGILLVSSVVYLLFAVKVAIPFFRDGEGVHYARYYAEFGSSFTEIAWNMATRPDRVLGRLLNLQTLMFAISLLAPLGFLPLLSPSRLLVGVPLFGLLCLNNIAQDPRHQFHAPLVAILLWASAYGIVSGREWIQRIRARLTAAGDWSIPIRPNENYAGWQPEGLAVWGLACALQTGLWFSLSPMGVTFWDANSNWSWQQLYRPTERAAAFSKIADLIPATAKVASTDYVHPRYTHYERSYDYSKYPRKVSGYELRVPEDTDYIVIDARGPYSAIHEPSQIPEFAQYPEKWELLPDTTNGYFIVLKRRWESP
ncbi:membrane protein-like protein [Planctopirus limnophila DSM 3776]|uniref:Membrane protein-like protein n=1 Tax=Planctopirus limnophila (strain ATCC 43296 / DSM 3776 / IFAM 1008 / Mu 290) TaxID=521674 RepID=D5SVA0_PLAL2|nr:DUF2079 domain-containing protein [Planctopirus limnophila]ADG67170.1 membrane protein-like protein [Planctopirus limnophila DSM 3776]